MEKTISFSVAKRSFWRLLRAAKRGQTHVITFRGKPIAKFLPVDEAQASREPEAKRAKKIGNARRL